MASSGPFWKEPGLNKIALSGNVRSTPGPLTLTDSFVVFQLANAPAAHTGKVGVASKSTKDEDQEIERMLAQLKA